MLKQETKNNGNISADIEICNKKLKCGCASYTQRPGIQKCSKLCIYNSLYIKRELSHDTQGTSVIDNFKEQLVKSWP